MAATAALLATVLLHCGLASKQLHVKYQWTTPEFLFTNESMKQSMIDSGRYIPGNPFMLDVDSWQRGSTREVFVTTPRFLPGTPATLSLLSRAHASASPLLQPFPSWAMNRQGDCDAMTSVLRVQVDTCGRLWAIDSGVVDLMTAPQSLCAPQVLVFDLRTSRLLHRYRIPPENLREGSLLINIAVELPHRGSCRGAVAYLADVTQHGLVVYDVSQSRSWRVSSSFFQPSPPATHFTVAGESFTLQDGLFGLALGPVVRGDRTLYFHSLASYREVWVRTSLLRNQSLFAANTSAAAGLFTQSPGERSSQTAATAMSRRGVLFFSPLANTSLNCWNSRLPYTSSNLVQLVRDDEALQFVSGMKIVRDRSGREVLWALSCRFQRLMTGSFDPAEVNFRVLTAPVADLVRGTSCDGA
ncbi:protein yellow-like [Bacillus rossius redtenbacheri]|uniref:protein yellow-like n=1 Tax=Bacillus rossius redtenbacheri TaxID=93214 RepID=UPI002FDEA43F